MLKLAGKVALITGAAGVIGSAAARRFVDEGAQVFLSDFDESRLTREIVGLNPDCYGHLAADVTDPVQVAAVVAAAKDRFGGIDILLANAGIEGSIGPRIDASPLDAFDRVMATNVRGTWLTLKYAIPAMIERGGGSVVISSSVAGLVAVPGAAAYVASKHAVIGLAKAAAVEYAADGVRVNTINPAPVESRMMRAIEEGLAPSAASAAKAHILGTIPAGRYATADDVVNLMVFLASDESRFCTGASYLVDGGICAV